MGQCCIAYCVGVILVRALNFSLNYRFMKTFSFCFMVQIIHNLNGTRMCAVCAKAKKYAWHQTTCVHASTRM